MPNYNLNVLQPAEFEDLARDLIQKQFGVFVESFTTGRDSGIDLRFATINGGKSIVQAKRYKDYSSLLSNLKGEVDKVRRINPDNYYVVTSVGLTPRNKDDIKELFAPYIKDTTQILGSNDINNLLGNFDDVEKKHYKLWLTSTNILQSIINKEVINWSDFELQHIKQQIATYVPNKSLEQARNILSQYNYVIISGIPGIGKTTLANILLYDYLAHGYEEFVNIPGDMDNASKLYDPHKKQVFFFDDFLGANVFEDNGSGFAQKLISFIRVVKKDNSKKFILTTREYILRDANIHYEKIRNENIELAKCVLDIASYTKTVRAKILYNHIANADLPKEYISEFLKDKGYRWIIGHRNFNPRVIETYIDKQLWIQVPVSEFMNRFKEFFSNPHMVWEMAFENLKPESQYALMVLASMGGEVSIESWNKAYSHFGKLTSDQLQLKYDDITWNKTVKILHDCFIRTGRYQGLIVVTFHNPSVRDFIANYIEKSAYTQRLLLEGAFYPEQLTSLYDEFLSQNMPEIFRSNNISLSDSNLEIVRAKLIEFLSNNPESCKLSRTGISFIKNSYSKTAFLKSFSDRFPSYFKKIQNQLLSILLTQITEGNNTDFFQRIQLIKRMNWSNRETELRDVLNLLINEDKDIDDYPELLKLLHETGNIDLIDKTPFLEKMEEEMIVDMDTMINGFADYEEREELYLEIEKRLPDGVALSRAFSRLQEIRDSLEDIPDENDEDSYRESSYDNEQEDFIIDRLMDSLLQ